MQKNLQQCEQDSLSCEPRLTQTKRRLCLSILTGLFCDFQNPIKNRQKQIDDRTGMISHQ